MFQHTIVDFQLVIVMNDMLWILILGANQHCFVFCVVFLFETHFDFKIQEFWVFGLEVVKIFK